MRRIVLPFFLILSFICFQSVFAQEAIGEEEQLNTNPIFVQDAQQSLFNNSQPIEGSNWEWLHPTPQGNTLRWVKMWDADNWYAIGNGGTFLKTTDGGVTWMVKILINGLSASGASYDFYNGYFLDTNTGFALGTNGIICRTTDGGFNWTIIQLGTTGSLYGMYFLNATVGYVSGLSSAGIWKTTDAGLTWTGPIAIPGTAYSIYAVDENTLYNCSSSGNFRRTTDAGITWTTINVGFSSTLNDMLFTDPLNGWVCGAGANVAYTTDGGFTWTSVGGSNIPVTSAMRDVDIIPIMAQTLNEGFENVTFPPTGWHSKNLVGTSVWERSTTYANTGVGSARILHESTGGEDWLVTPQVHIEAGDTLKFWVRKAYSSNYIPDSLYILVSSTDTAITSFSTVIAGFNVNAFTTIFTEYAIDLSAFADADIYVAFRHLDSDGNGMYMDDVTIGTPMAVQQVFVTGDPFDIYTTIDKGVTWNPVPFLGATQSWTDTYYRSDFLASNNFVTVGNHGLINEVAPNQPATAHITSIKDVNCFDIWAQGVTGRVISVGEATTPTAFDQAMYSTDGGETWAISTMLDSADLDMNKLSMVDPLTGYTAGEDHRVMKTTDGGATWFRVTDPATSTSDLEACSFVDANTGYVFGASGNGYKTTDGGTTWSTLTTGVTVTLYGSYFLDALTGYVCGSTGNLLMTTDGGTTFTPQTSNSSSTLYSIYMVNSNVGYLSGSVGTVRKTTDAGVTWAVTDLGTTATLYDIEFTNEQNGMTVGSSGRTYSTNDGGVTWNFDNNSMGSIYAVSIVHTSQDTIAVYVSGFAAYIMRNSHVLVPVTTTFQLSVPVFAGWNMVSAPGTNPDGMLVGNWWAHLTGTVWLFNGSQYIAALTAVPGVGYWMENTVGETYYYPAIGIVDHDPIPVTTGWNLIGGYETSPTITALKAANPQITGTVWGYNGSQYVAATNLVPGNAYWVEVTTNDPIIIPSALTKGSGEVVELFKEDWGRIILTDAEGKSYTLYAVKGKVDLDQYKMPPLPPAGSFDIRFSSGRIAENINSSMQTIDMIGVTYPLTVRVEGMDIRLQDVTGSAVNVSLKSGEDVVISDATIQKLMVTGEVIPTVYALEQNYPNPFNPSTVIEFSLPEDVSNVKLSIYNALGEKVAEIVNSSLTAGKYQYQWNAQNAATGMYIYELRTDKFVSVKKMLLLK